MYPNNSNDSSFLSDNSLDQFDSMVAGVMQSSIAMAFRQLVEPVDNNKNKNLDSKSTTPPPLKLHDFGGSDFVRLAEKSRRNRSATSKPQEPGYHGLENPITSSNGNGSPSFTSTGSKHMSLAVENESTMKQTQQQSSPNIDWKCTQECVFRTDGSEETVYQKFHDGQVTETLHHVLYPDGTIKDIKKPMITTSRSATSSLSSMADDATPTGGPIKRLWHLVFD